MKNGEGALGALVSDQKLGQKVTDTVEDVTDLAGERPPSKSRRG